jgi:hypothetical protein
MLSPTPPEAAPALSIATMRGRGVNAVTAAVML